MQFKNKSKIIIIFKNSHVFPVTIFFGTPEIEKQFTNRNLIYLSYHLKKNSNEKNKSINWRQ